MATPLSTSAPIIRSRWFGLSLAALCSATVHADLVVHWKLDEADGDYTAGGYLEEVSGQSGIAKEIALPGDVLEGEDAVAPDGGSSTRFADADTASGTHISAGSIENNGGQPGDYVAGPATAPYVLGATFTLTCWFNPEILTGERVMFSNRFGSNTGILVGTREATIFMDFGNTRATYTPSPPLVTGQNYLITVRQDLDGDTNFGWATESNHRISLYDPTTESWQHFDGMQNKTGLNLQEMSIGNFTNSPREWIGLVDDVRVYNHTLTQDELDLLLLPAVEGDPLALSVSSSGDDLVFSWTGRANMVYTLRATSDLSLDPLTWEPVMTGIEGTPPTNSLTIPRPGDATRFFLIEENPPPPIFVDDFESDLGWTSGSDGADGTTWERGTPTIVGPLAAYSADNCYGTNLASEYGTLANVWLRSPAIALTDPGLTAAFLTFQQFKDYEDIDFEQATVGFLDAADDTLLAPVTFLEGPSIDWEEATVDLPAAALGKSVRIEFRFQSDDQIQLPGWYLDDVELNVR